jgi:hypothetical protein
MMIRGFQVIILLILFLQTNVLSQQLSHQVLVPLAGVASNTKISYSQTVGETAVEIVRCSDFIFTQGFQQPGIKFSKESPPPGTGVQVYPNPVNDYLTIELFGETSRKFRIDIINIAGIVVFTTRKVFEDQYWYKEQHNTENLIRGFYLIRVISDDGMINRSFKIEKI